MPAMLPPRAIRPAPGPVNARIRVPGSKSITNRVLLLAALAEGHGAIDNAGTDGSDGWSRLENALFSEDSLICAECLRQLGIAVRADAAQQVFEVQGRGGRLPATEADLFVGNSGTTARFLVAAAALGQGRYRFDGVPRMRQRPIGPLLGALRLLGAQIEAATLGPLEGAENVEGAPEAAPAEGFPLTVWGQGLRGGQAVLDASISSQYLSALLQVAPYAAQDCAIVLTDKLVSEPYINMTLHLMARFGVQVEVRLPTGAEAHDKPFYRKYLVRAGQRYRAQRHFVEPDASNASYFFAAAAVTGGQVHVAGLTADSLQGDIGFVDVLAQMGCDVLLAADGIEVRGPVRLRGIEVDLNAMSDTVPTLAAIAPFADRPVAIHNVGHIRLKETDRIAALVTELRKLGVRVEEQPDALTIYPSAVQPGAVETYDDHRMAMAFAVTGLAAPGISIKDPGCTAKTFPTFFECFDKLYEP